MTRRDDKGVAAARAVILELMGILGEYREQLVLVGGWVPSLLLPEPKDLLERHPGSLDVDLAVNHRSLTEAAYQTIDRLLRNAGYQRSSQQPFQYVREIQGVKVRVDLLAGEYGGTGASHRTQKVQDARPRKTRGCDLVFQISPEVVLVRGRLPGGSLDTAQVPVSSVVPFIVMKAIAMSGRRKNKDAFDIWYVLSHFRGGVEAVAERLRPHLDNGLVREGLEALAQKFGSPEHVGPRDAAEFDPSLGTEERAVRQRDAYERVRYLLDLLGYHIS
jgi:hypothetical protein